MSAEKLEGYDEALKILVANQTPRLRHLEGLERWVLGTQYEGRPSWWDDTVPRWERSPCIVYPVVAIAASSNVDMVLGEGRYPDFTVGPEDESDEEGGLGPDASETFDRFLRDYFRLSRFKAHCREAFFSAQGSGTAVGIYGVRGDKPFCHLVHAKWAVPTFGPLGEVTELEIKYPYVETYRKPDGKWAARCRLYRRVIDATSDTTFLPGVAKEDGKEPNWQPDPAQTMKHGFGFCPVVWYPFMKGCVATNVIDGRAIHALLTDEIFAHDLALSTKHHGALLSEPQIVETGVSPGYNPTDSGRTAIVPTTLEGGAITNANPVTGHFVDGGPSKEARKKGPGYVWQYQSPDAKVDVLTYPGDALKAQEENAKDLLRKLQEAMAIVFLDPENVKLANTLSGKALDSLKQRQIDRCDQYRDDFADGFLTPAIEMQLRIAAKVRPKKVRSLPKALPSIAKEPEVRIVWGPYSRPDPAEQKIIVELVRKALGEAGDEPIITSEIALTKLADIFNIENVKAVLEQLQKEREERMQEAHEQAAQQVELEASANADRGSGSPEKSPEAA